MNITKNGATATVAMDKELDSVHDWDLLDDLLQDGDVDEVVLDFSETTYINSSSFGSVVQASMSATDLGKGFKLVNLNDKISMVFQTLGGFELLTIE